MVEGINNNLNIVGVITARGGSKRVPLKNIKPVNGKPLITYMINAALGSKYLRRVIVSTDHEGIKQVSLDSGAEVPFTRPEKLAEDVPSEMVTQHAVEFIENEESRKIDIVVTMQPTTPFCISEDIDACIELVAEKGFDSAFAASVVRERPEWMFIMKKGIAQPLTGGVMQGERGVYQTLDTLYIPNGAAYATKRDSLFKENAVITRHSSLHVMPDERSVDIDEPIDMLYAEFLSKQKEIKYEQVS
ncbi:MAG: acylneuraminate cytidylyltransferase family protein [Thermodesulfovibrionia bacterium]|nr:acylneuraminate cytidylyltransferase family protein [Thermodesulfovibrionia bacterium]